MSFLTREKLHELTGKKTNPAILRSLKFMGIEHKIRPDGFPIVPTNHVEKILDGHPLVSSRIKSKPNFEALYNAKKKKS